MKKHTLLTIVLLMVLFAFLGAGPSRAQDTGPQMPDTVAGPAGTTGIVGTVITYQGQLILDGSPVNGSCDMTFNLFDSLDGAGQVGTVLTQTVTVSNGKFSVQLDFGAGAFPGQGRWLGIAVRCPAGSGSYTPLTPRQQLTPAPVALSLPGLWTQENATSPDIIGGYSGNSVSPNIPGATISGGGAPTGCGSDGNSPCPNHVSGYYATVSGGYGNTANYRGANVGGGYNNTARGEYATVAGGSDNTVSMDYSTVGGGWNNNAGEYGWFATVSGGYNNTAGGPSATIPGGYQNTANGYFSFAAGHYAKADHDGSFVWADESDYYSPITFTTSTANQFLIQAVSGVGVGTNDTLANGLTVNGQVVAGGTATGVMGGEPFIARGANAGISLDDRAAGSSQRWVIYPNNGSLNFWRGSNKMTLNSAGVLTLYGLGSAGTDHLCRNASNEISQCSSSLRYKTNVVPLAMGLDVVELLRPVTFDWKENGQPDLGLVAEEVDLVAPLLTTYNADGQIEGVKYDRLSAVLVKAVQEQQGQIAALKAQVAQLEQGQPARDNHGLTVNGSSLALAAIGALLAIVIVQSLFLWLLAAPRLIRRRAS